MPGIQLSDIQAAAERTRGIVRRTPVFTSRTFDALAGARVFFKCENFQRGGAFKIRGASNFILSIPKDQLPRGVVTFSSGNHGQAVAIVAESVGIPATIVMPADAPALKLEATRALARASSRTTVPKRIAKPLASASPAKPALRLFRPTIILGPSRDKARLPWSCWLKYPISTRSWSRSVAAG